MAGSNFGISPTESHHTALSRLDTYASEATSISKKERRNLNKIARELAEINPADAYAFVSEAGRGYTNYRPIKLLGRLATMPVNYDQGGFKSIASSAFQDLLNREATEGELQQYNSAAKALGIKDADAYEQFLSKRLASTQEGQRKIKSEADIAWESQYGDMPRDAQGNLARGMVRFNATNAQNIANAMLG